MAKRLLCIGECMVEMASIGQDRYQLGFAGDTFNTAWHARRALPGDWEVAYFSCIGEDPMSVRMRAFMDKAGIATDTVTGLPGGTPGLYLIDLDHGERSFTYWRSTSAARQLAADPVRLQAAIDASDAVFFSGITCAILPEADRDRMLDMLGEARSSGKMIAFDSNIRLRLWPDTDTMAHALGKAVRAASLALPTWPDDRALFPCDTAMDLARHLQGLGVGEVVVKAGAEAATVVSASGTWHVAPEPGAIIVDTTGAGDSFNAAYLATRLTGGGEEAAARAGHALARRVIASHGALLPEA